MYEHDGTQSGARLSEVPTSQLFSHHKLCMCECVYKWMCVRLHSTRKCMYRVEGTLYVYTVGISIQEQSNGLCSVPSIMLCMVHCLLRCFVIMY